MCYLAIHVGSIEALKCGDFEEVQTRVRSESLPKDKLWITPKGYWVPYFKLNDDACGIILNVIRHGHVSMASLSSKYLRAPDCHKENRRLHLTDGLWKGILSFEMEIAFLRQMSCYGRGYKTQADIVENAYLYDSIEPYLSMGTGTMYDNITNDAINTIAVVPRYLDNGEPELSIFYFTDLTEVALTTNWAETKRKLPLLKTDFIKYNTSKFPYLYEMNFSDSLNRFLKEPESCSLLEKIFDYTYRLRLF